MTLAWHPINAAIGAEAQADKAALLGGAHAAELRALLEGRAVLIFPRADFTADEHAPSPEQLVLGKQLLRLSACQKLVK